MTYETYYLGLLADVLRDQGEHEEGRRVVEEALDLARRTGEGFYEAELHRLRGELSPPDRPDEAQQSFQQALAVASRQEAKSLELRAAISWTRLTKSAESLTALRNIHARFNEGFQTPDLQEAKDLLNGAG